MKKLRKIWALALLAAGFALAFSGCKNSTSGGGDQTLTPPGGEDDPNTDVNTGLQSDGSLILASRTISSQPKFVSEKVLELKENKWTGGGNIQGTYEVFAADNSYVPTKGDTIIVSFKLKANNEVSFGKWKGLSAILIDNTEGWKEISGNASIISGGDSGGNIPNTESDYTAVFSINNTVKSDSKVIVSFYYGEETSKEVTLTLSNINAVAYSGLICHETQDKGYIDFSGLQGYPDEFDAANYKKVTAKFQLVKDGKAVTSKSEGKVTINDSALEGSNNIFNGGYGDGFVRKYLNNFTPDANGIVSIEFDLTGVDGISKANCFSAQLDKTNTLSVKEAKFEK